MIYACSNGKPLACENGKPLACGREYECYFNMRAPTTLPLRRTRTRYPYPACEAFVRYTDDYTNIVAFFGYGPNVWIAANVPGAPTISQCAPDYVNPDNRAPTQRLVNTLFGPKLITWWGISAHVEGMPLGVFRVGPSTDYPNGRTIIEGARDNYFWPSESSCQCLQPLTFFYQSPCCDPAEYIQVHTDNFVNSGPFAPLMILPCGGGGGCWSATTPEQKNAGFRAAIRYLGRTSITINMEKRLTDAELWQVATGVNNKTLFHPDWRPFISLIRVTFTGPGWSWSSWASNEFWVHSIDILFSTLDQSMPSFSYNSLGQPPRYQARWPWLMKYITYREGFIPISPSTNCLNESSQPNGVVSDTGTLTYIELTSERWTNW